MGFSKASLKEYIDEDRQTLEEQDSLYGKGDSRHLYSECLSCLECDIGLFSVCFEESEY